MKPYLRTERATLYHGRAEEMYEQLTPGSVSMVWSDGRYGLGKSEAGGWDDGGVDSLSEWYSPHVEAWGRLCAPSATVYLWGTAKGHRRLDPLIRSYGWNHRVDVTWLKTNPPSQKGQEALTCWPDFTEVCAVYQRNAWELDIGAGALIAEAAGRDERNWIRDWLIAEWRDEAGLGGRPNDLRPDGRPWRSHADRALGTNGIGGHYFNTALWSLPTWEAYQKLAAYAAQHGPTRERPYLVHPRVWPGGDLRTSYELLRASHDRLRVEYEHLRAEYDALRVPFNAPDDFSNVWTAPMVPPTRRLRAADGETHECEKPLAFVERAICASTRPGDLVLDPFAGTNRVALVATRLPPEEVRYVVSAELDERWLHAIRPALVADYTRTANPRQPSLFQPR